MHTRNQFSQNERLTKAIISAGIQGCDPVFHAVARAQQKNGHIIPVFPKCAEHVETVTVRKQGIQYQRIEGRSQRSRQSRFAGVQHIRSEALGFQGAADKRRDFHFRLNYQHTHGP